MSLRELRDRYRELRAEELRTKVYQLGPQAMLLETLSNYHGMSARQMALTLQAWETEMRRGVDNSSYSVEGLLALRGDDDASTTLA
jgi:hypothetical protein